MMGCALVMVIIHGGPQGFETFPLHVMKYVNN